MDRQQSKKLKDSCRSEQAPETKRVFTLHISGSHTGHQLGKVGNFCLATHFQEQAVVPEPFRNTKIQTIPYHIQQNSAFHHGIAMSNLKHWV